MLCSSVLVAVAGLVSVAFAQTSTSTSVSVQSSAITDVSAAVTASSVIIASTGSSVPTAGASSYPINPGAINSTIKTQWCLAQDNSCYSLCNNDPSTINCDSTTLTYACVCSDGTTPDLAKYNQTIPYFECLTYVANCVAATNNAQSQRVCLATKCGGLNASDASVTTTSASTMGTSASMTGASTAATTSASGVAAIQTAGNYGYGIFALVAAAFGLLL